MVKNETKTIYELVAKYQCEICERWYRHEKLAERCEQKHKDFNNQQYRDYLVKLNFDRLNEAASMPGQEKLIQVGK